MRVPPIASIKAPKEVNPSSLASATIIAFPSVNFGNLFSELGFVTLVEEISGIAD